MELHLFNTLAEIAKTCGVDAELTPQVKALNIQPDELAALDGNVSLGRPLTSGDVIKVATSGIYPISREDGEVYCYCCQQYKGLNLNALKPLSSDTGVFTADFECPEGSPVWVCFSCMPMRGKQFDWLAPAAQQILLDKTARKQKIESAMSVFRFSFLVGDDRVEDSEPGISQAHACQRICKRHNITNSENADFKLVQQYDPGYLLSKTA